jgi:inorganic pyrophosphatase
VTAALGELPARARGGAFHVVVESPRGSRVKIKYDPELRVFRYSRPLALGVHYPYDWGFVPSTRAADGDPLDAMVLVGAPTAPGVVIESRALGVLRVTQKDPRGGGRIANDRVIAVPANEPRWSGVGEVPPRWREELAGFFEAAVILEGKELRIERWDGAAAGEALVDETRI